MTLVTASGLPHASGACSAGLHFGWYWRLGFGEELLGPLGETPASPVIMIETLHWAVLGERQSLAMRSRRGNGSGLAWTQRMKAGEVVKDETPSTAGSRPRLNERNSPDQMRQLETQRR